MTGRVNTAHKGRRAEYKARARLEAAGFSVVRAAASKGAADLIAWNAHQIRLISVKSGSRYLSKAERAAFMALAIPANATRECWRYPDRCKLAPIVERL